MNSRSLRQAASQRYLIVNADDFGRSPAVNRGVAAAHEQGIVTSASLMVRRLASAEAAIYTPEHPELSLGLHADFGEWVYQDGVGVCLYEVVPSDDEPAILVELERQLAAFRRLLGQDPTHVDSHQHVHRSEPARSIFARLAEGLGIPLRECSPAIRHCGNFYGQDGRGKSWPETVSVERLIEILAALPSGITELGCHPGDEDDFETVYRDERRREVAALCDPRVRAAIEAEQIQLGSFADLRSRWPGQCVR